MGIYGSINESKETKKSLEITGIKGEIEDKISELVLRSDIAIILASWPKFQKEVAEKYYEYIEEIRKNSSEDFASNFKSINDVLKNIKLKSWRYFVLVKENGNKVIRSFNPYIDFKNPPDEHVPSIEAIVEDTGVRLAYVYFDG